ncbi:MAG: PilZ domain-containing protein [Polyangiaceae bacterium]|nr:PilZ domain-containing protein [Polyangiaceae bacterium]
MPKLDHFRAFPRQKVALTATVVVPSGWQASASLLNLSLTGACLDVREGLEPGLRLRLAISIPTLWDPLEIEAVTAWVSGSPGGTASRAGVHFDRLDGPTLRTLLQLIESTAS